MANNSLLHTTNFINKKTLEGINSKINNLEKKMECIDKKLDFIIEFFEKDVKKNCDKMGEHIDFVENIYDNVKNPLGYLCSKINYLSGRDKRFTLTDVENNSDFDSDEDELL